MQTILPRFALLVFSSLATAALAASLTGSGKPVTETRAVSGFTGISFSVPGQLELTQGDQESLVITADDNVLPEFQKKISEVLWISPNLIGTPVPDPLVSLEGRTVVVDTEADTKRNNQFANHCLY